MAGDIKGLIEKIQHDGINLAQAKAKEIEGQAKAKADEIIRAARLEAERILSEAKDKIAKSEEKEKSLLTQAGRDLLLVLRKEISAMLDKIVTLNIKDALTPQALADIISAIIKAQAQEKEGEVIITLRKEDKERLEKGFLAKFKEGVQRDITLKASEDMQAGFIISYDAGKSHYDFSDKALADYIGSSLKPQLNNLLKDAVK